MKCPNCGALLKDDALFCRDCGTKISIQKRFCRECGHEIEPGTRHCEYCGSEVRLLNDSPGDMESISVIGNHNARGRSTGKRNTSSNRSRTRVETNNRAQRRNDSLMSSPINKMIIIATIIICIVIFFAFLIKHIKEGNKTIDLAISSITPFSTSSNELDTSHTYAYMRDEWDVYIAVPISTSVIKVEHWDRSNKSKPKMTYNSDIGTYKISDETSGFHWIDNEHMAFMLTIKDEHNSRIDVDTPVVFTINIYDNDEYKGTDFCDYISCYKYVCDDWDEYLAIPLSDNLVKIEAWTRGSSSDDFLYGYDFLVVNPNSNETDFEWADDNHSAFTITTIDPDNEYHWKEPTFVSFTRISPDYQYNNVLEYISAQKNN